MFWVSVACADNSDKPGEVLVFAATSLTDALNETKTAYEAREGPRLALSFGASQLLARQISDGAPADVFISAGQFPVDFLVERALIEPDVIKLLTNKLVLTRRPSVSMSQPLGETDGPLDGLLSASIERIAIADPELAPAGRYAREALRTLGLWDRLQSKVIFGADVRATLTYVESGNADVALVYATDAKSAPGVEILDVIPVDSYPPIVYPVARTVISTARPEVADFLDFLQGREVRAILRKYGFEPA